MRTSLDSLRLGVQAVVEDISTKESLRLRLRDFGFVPGTQICCQYRTPDGSVTAVECRGSVIALRTGDLAGIEVRC